MKTQLHRFLCLGMASLIGLVEPLHAAPLPTPPVLLQARPHLYSINALSAPSLSPLHPSTARSFGALLFAYQVTGESGPPNTLSATPGFEIPGAVWMVAGIGLFYTVVLVVNAIYRSIERSGYSSDEEDLANVDVSLQWDSRVLYTRQESAYEMRIIPGFSAHATNAPTAEMDYKIDRAKIILIEEVQKHGMKIVPDKDRTLTPPFNEIGISARALMIALTPELLLRHLWRLIPFAPINFTKELKTLHVEVLSDPDDRQQPIAFGSDLENLLYIDSELVERLNEVQLAGLLARKAFEMHAKRIVRTHELSWSSVLSRVEFLAKALEIQIAGKGDAPGTSAVDAIMTPRDLDIEVEAPSRLFVSPIPSPGTLLQGALRGVSLQLTTPPGLRSGSRDRTQAWASALGVLEIILDVDPAERRSMYDQITEFEKTLWTELREAAHPIDAQSPELYEISDRILTRTTHEPELVDTFLHTRKLNPKTMIAFTLAAFMLARRDLPQDLLRFWMEGRAERRLTVAQTMEVFYTDFADLTESLLLSASDALNNTRGRDAPHLMGQLAELIRFIGMHREDFEPPRAFDNTRAVLRRLASELGRPQDPIGNKTYKAPRYALNDVRQIVQSNSSEITIPLASGPSLLQSMDPAWKMMIQKYLRYSADHVMEQCLTSALAVLARTNGDKQAALSASYRAYTRNPQMRRAIRSLNLSGRLRELFLNGPGKMSFNMKPPNRENIKPTLERVIVEISNEPIETSLMGLGTGRSLDFSASQFFNIEHLRPYIRHPRLKVLYAYEELPDGSKGKRLARLTVGLTKRRELLALSHITYYEGVPQVLQYPFLAYLKKWSDMTGFPIIFWLQAKARSAIALGYKPESAPLVLTIPEVVGEPMILHSDLKPNNTPFPVKTKLENYLRYDPKERPDQTTHPGNGNPVLAAFLPFVPQIDWAVNPGIPWIPMLSAAVVVGLLLHPRVRDRLLIWGSQVFDRMRRGTAPRWAHAILASA